MAWPNWFKSTFLQLSSKTVCVRERERESIYQKLDQSPKHHSHNSSPERKSLVTLHLILDIVLKLADKGSYGTGQLPDESH